MKHYFSLFLLLIFVSSCTPVTPPPCLPEWSCSAYGSWSNINCGTRSRTCDDVNNCNDDANKPISTETLACSGGGGGSCTSDWACSYGDWTNKDYLCGTRTGTCHDKNNCVSDRPISETMLCPCFPEWSCSEYGAWSDSSNACGSRTRVCSDTNSCNDLTGKPIESESKTCTTTFKTYYVSNSGSDSNNGLSILTPIKTIAKVNTLNLQPGDSVLFKRGERWDLLYDATITDKSGSIIGNITYGAYGIGDKPILTRSIHSTNANEWISTTNNIWESTFTINDEVGLLIFNNEASYGNKKSSLSLLTTQGDFYYDTASDKTYLYSATNPILYYTIIELSKKGNIFDLNSANYIEIKDLDLRYSAKDAVFIINSNNIYLTGLTTRYIGGAYQSGTLRYGNALEVLGTSSNIYFTNNNIYQTYDAGVSAQIGKFTNIYMKENIIIKARYSYEFFNHETDKITDTIIFDHNTCIDSGLGFGGTANGKGVRTGTMDGYIKDFNITNNIFSGATQYLVEMQPKFTNSNSHLNNNLYFQTSYSGGIYWLGSVYTYGNINNYKTASGEDSNSVALNPNLDSNYKPSGAACTMSSTGSYVGAVKC